MSVQEIDEKAFSGVTSTAANHANPAGQGYRSGLLFKEYFKNKK
jgi:hypothetical protein